MKQKQIIHTLHILLFSILIPFFSAFALEHLPNELFQHPEKEFVFRLNNGDLVTGIVIESINDPTEGEGIRLKTELGRAVIFANQIADFYLKDKRYRHNHRIYLQPTAEPISNNYFIGAFQLLFVYAGGGIADIVSLTLGRSLIPSIPANDQLSLINAKATVFTERFENIEGSFSFAIGANLGFANHNNRLIHYYTVASFKGERTLFNGTLFYKSGTGNSYGVYFGHNKFDMTYQDGSLGIGLGLDTKFSKWHELHFIGELWNTNVSKPPHTAVLLGFRLANTTFSADFGLSFFTVPYVAPFVSFTYTPF